ncbi:MAG: Card1-like endonuclease domain-containing protein [Brevinematia bacterium]
MSDLDSRFDKLKELISKLGFHAENLKKNELRYITGGWFEEYIYQIIKNESKIEENFILLNPIISRNNVTNELDVVVCYENKIYLVECKTSTNTKNHNILLDTLYKQGALRKDFGLSVNSIVVILDEVNEDNKKRTNYMNIKILDKPIVMDDEKFKKELLNILGVKKI